jgi:anti-anti-sigma regulatory factor
MIKIKTYRNTILVSFEDCTRLNKIDSYNFKQELINKLTYPYSNVMVDFHMVEEINSDTIDALIAGQRLSVMNRGQVSLFNVEEKVYKSFKTANVDHLFFFCDLPKPFSQEILMA